jgi:hypothetical protein
MAYFVHDIQESENSFCCYQAFFPNVAPLSFTIGLVSVNLTAVCEPIA